MNQGVLPKTELLKRIKAYSENFLMNKIPVHYSFHNLDHTYEVVQAAKEIGSGSNLAPEEMEEVLLAAWLHDTGYSRCCSGHEEESIQITRDILAQNGAPDDKIERIVHCIQATKFPQNPHNLMEKVMCDADMAHLAQEDYFKKAELLRKEASFLKGHEIDQYDWLKTNNRFFKNHNYFTDYAKTSMIEPKEKNRKKIKKRLKELAHNDENISEPSYKDNGNSVKNVKDKPGKSKKPERGIETMFRTTSHNHLELSSIADNKANIMISINSIIVSILVSVMFRKFDAYPNLIIPTVILTGVCLLTIIFAILATRPNVTEGRFTKEDIFNKKTNLLFFGNFHNMALEDYEWGIKEIMKDSEFLYSSMTRDIYFLGKVLGRKYTLLRISYNIFMFGFVLSVLSFAIAMMFFK